MKELCTVLAMKSGNTCHSIAQYSFYCIKLLIPVQVKTGSLSDCKPRHDRHGDSRRAATEARRGSHVICRYWIVVM